MKTKEELAAIKEEVAELNRKLAELTDDELAQVVGGKGIKRLEDSNEIAQAVIGNPPSQIPMCDPWPNF